VSVEKKHLMKIAKEFARAFLIVGFIGFVLYAFSAYDGPDTTEETPSAATEATGPPKVADASTVTDPPNVADPVPPPPKPIPILAVDLWKAYEQNEVAANQKYLDRRLAVTGRIDEIEDTMHGPVVRLRTHEYYPGSWSADLDCNFARHDRPALARLKKGHKITITGTCGGELIGSVQVRNCTLPQ